MKFIYIRANPKQTSQARYNELALEYQLTKGYQFIMDFVYDVEGQEIKEIDSQEFNRLHMSNAYG